MPILAFLSLQEKSDSFPPVTNYGFESGFFSEIDELFRQMSLHDEELDRQDTDRIKAKLLRTGPCPGNARVYHQFVSDPEIEGGNEQIEKLLGRSVNLSRRDAGQALEDWVDEANESLNEWLETRDSQALEEMDIPEKLREHYLNRLDQIEEKAEELDIEKSQLKIDVQHEIFTRYFHAAEPDGAWIPDEIPGGVFESKLSLPPEPVDRHELAGYAVHIERAQDLPVDFGVYLYLDDDMNEIELKEIYIDDVLRERIKENIEIFSALAFDSISEEAWDESIPLSRRLLEPHEPKYNRACRNCAYTRSCHEGGKYFDLRDDTYQDISNLKLSGTHLEPILEAIFDAQPHRDDVADRVMENFPGKSRKSVFRGMVIPTLKRLQLIRIKADASRIMVSPNGKMIFEYSSTHEGLKQCVRDYTVSELNFSRNAVDYFRENASLLSEGTHENFEENIGRFYNQYLDYFDIRLPEEDDAEELVDAVYRGESAEPYLTNRELRREWLLGALPHHEMTQFDRGRWRLLKWLLDHDVLATTWLVDTALWREWRSEGRVIDLWEGSTHSDARLSRNGSTYDAIIVERNNDR